MSSDSLPIARANEARAVADKRVTEVAQVTEARVRAAESAARRSLQVLDTLREDFRESVEAANRRMAGDGRSLDVLVDEQTRMLIVRINDRETGEQIRQVPPESALSITRNIDRLTGILVDRKA